MWTICTPFIYKPYAIRLWLESFKKLNLPRSEMNLVWLDMSEDEKFSSLLKGYLDANSGLYKSVDYLNDVNKIHRNTQVDPYHWQDENFIERRLSIAETMQILREGVGKNHMLLLEDDLVFPENSFEKMLEVFNYSEKFHSVCACNYTRNPDVPDGSLLAWDFSEERIFAKEDTCKDTTINIWRKPHERKQGIEFVGASATGMTLYRNTFIGDYQFNARSGWGQDIMAGYDINEIEKYGVNGGENKLVVCWDVKLPHIGLDKQDRFKIYRSEQCKTEVTDEHGIRF